MSEFGKLKETIFKFDDNESENEIENLIKHGESSDSIEIPHKIVKKY